MFVVVMYIVVSYVIPMSADRGNLVINSRLVLEISLEEKFNGYVEELSSWTYAYTKIHLDQLAVVIS